MSVKLVYSSDARGDYRDDSGFCYCRRNASNSNKRKPERKSEIEIGDEEGPIDAVVDFGSVCVGSRQFHEFIVKPTKNTLYRHDISEAHDVGGIPIECAFRFVSPASTTLPRCALPGQPLPNWKPKSSFRVYFEPDLPGTHFVQTVHLVVTPDFGEVNGYKDYGASQTRPLRIHCRGDTSGPALCFSENQINFGVQYYRDETKRGVKLINLSDCEAKFQFDIDNPRSTFKVCPTAGIVPPQTTLKLEITFCAPKPQAYYKRLMCFVLHQQPQFIDLFGVCIPRPFLPPLNGTGVAVSSCQTQFLPFPTQSNDDYLESDHRFGINLSSDQIDFGYHPADQHPLGDYEPLSFSSNLPYDCVIEWTPDASNVFVVTPQSAVLPANRSTLFQVSFRPNFPNVFYSGLLECFLHPTGYNWPPEIGPPWALVPRPVEELPVPVPEVEPVPEPETFAYHETAGEDAEQEEAAVARRVEISLNSTLSSPDLKKKTKGRRGKSNQFRNQSRKRSSASRRASKARRSTARSKAKLSRNQSIISPKGSTGKQKSVTDYVPLPIREPSLVPEPTPTEPSAGSFFKLILNLAHIQDEVPQTVYLDPVPMETVSTVVPFLGDTPEEPSTTEGQECQMPQQLGLPLCITLRLIGHTFLKPPAPVSTFKFTNRVVMDVTWPMRRTCRTVCLKNPTDFPVHFDASSIEAHGVYRMKPNKGVIPGNFHQLALLYMTPNSPHPLVYVQNSNLVLNLCDKNNISLYGSAEVPTIDIIRSYEGIRPGIVFPITVPNFESSVTSQFVNPTRYYCKFSLKVDDNEETFDTQIFNANPSTETVKPYEIVEVTWTFRPEQLLMYSQNWKCRFDIKVGQAVPPESLPHFQFTFPVSGNGESCRVEGSPSFLDFGLVELYTKETLPFTVTNMGNAEVTVYFQAVHEQWLLNFPANQIVLEPASVTIRGQESVEVQVIVRPNTMTMERFTICYALSEHCSMESAEHLCDVRFIGDHPVLQVMDIAHSSLRPICDGTFAWAMFSLDKLNRFLDYGSHYLAEEGRLKTPPTVVLNFPPAPIGSESAIFTLLLQNKGRRGTSWEIYNEPPKSLPQFVMDRDPVPFNGDDPTAPAYLASLWSRRIIDKYQPSTKILGSDLSHEKNICFSVKPFRDFAHFTVLPAAGRLELGQKVQISFRYQYKAVGAHDLYYLLHVNPSIFVWLHVKGHTLETGKPFVQQFYDQEVKLLPVALTDMDPPIQYLWLYNGGTVPAKVQIPPEPFKEFKKENFGHSVFDLVEQHGVILPRSWGKVKIRFSPIEYSDYKLDFVIKWEEQAILLKLNGSPLIHRTTLISPTELGLLFAERHSLLVDPIAPANITPIHVTLKQFIPTGLEDTSVVFLTSLSQESEVSFEWPQITEVEGGGSITFRPSRGILKPNEKVSCQILICGGDTSIMCTNLIGCTIVDITEQKRCGVLKKKWESCKSFLLCSKVCETEANARLLKKFGQRPQPYEPCIKVISVSIYVTSVFGMLDYGKTFENSKRTPVPPCKPIPAKTPQDIQSQPALTLPPFFQQLSREVLRTVLWDIVHSEHFEEFEKFLGGWKAPTFQEYFQSEQPGLEDKTDGKKAMKKHPDDLDPSKGRWSMLGSHDVLKEVLFNLVSELNSKYETGRRHPIQLGRIAQHQLYKIQGVTTKRVQNPSLL